MLNNIWFDGKSATEYGVRAVESYPDLNRAERKSTVFNVPGRSGDLVVLQDAWENIEKQYEIYAGDGSRGNLPGKFKSISEWLNAPGGYARLEDTYEPDVFRLAYCLGGYEAESAFNRHGRATITFNCRPERFLKIGEREITLTSGESVSSKIFKNPTAYKAKPLIYVQCTVGAGISYALNFNSGGETQQIWFTKEPLNGIYIDCETMNCYRDDGHNMNDYVLIDKFPVFAPGDVIFSTPKENYTVKVVPRWFVI